MRRFVPSCAGSISVATAVLFSLLVGMTGLGVEAASWFQTKRSMQGAADAAAVSAALALNGAGAGTCSSGSACTWAPGLHGLAVTAENGWRHVSTPSNGVTVTVVSPPTLSTSPFYNNPNAVEVWITQPQISLFGAANSIPATTIGAYAIAALTTSTSGGGECVLALANAANAVQVRGQGNLKANCGVAVDGGRSQNASGTPLGSLQLQGQGQVHISSLTIAGASSTACPASANCQQFGQTANPPAVPVTVNQATTAPAEAFPAVPLSVSSVVAVSAGAGYTNGTRTFTVAGGTATFPAKFTATVAGGHVTAILAVTDPGQYTALPSNPVSATVDLGGFTTAATFNLTEGCATWAGALPPQPGRKYCSISISGNGTTNFIAGTYFIAGGDATCVGFCVSGNNATVTSDVAGVTFALTNGEGAGTFGASSYARVNITSGSVTLCAPGTGCGTDCTGSCLLFIQDPHATATTDLSTGGVVTPATTQNTFAGNGTRNLSGLMYFPTQTVTLLGNGPVSGCVGVIAKYLDVGGIPSFSNGCLPGGGFGGTVTTHARLSE